MRLSAYKENGYNYTHVAVLVDKTGWMSDYEVGTKRSLEKRQYNGQLPDTYEILTFRQAAAKYPDCFAS